MVMQRKREGERGRRQRVGWLVGGGGGGGGRAWWEQSVTVFLCVSKNPYAKAFSHKA